MTAAPSSARPPSALPGSRLAPWLAGLALFALTAAVYAPAVGGGFVWDDDSYVTANVMLHDADGLRRIWTEPGAVPQYYPLAFTTFWAEYRLWGLQPFGYHAVNIALHAAASVLFWRALLALEVPGAWAAAAIFAVHPVHVESVAWITERKNVLSAALALGSVLLYLRFAGLRSGAQNPSRAWGWYAPAFALFVGALLSKTVTCALPAVLLLVVWWRRDRVTARDAAPLLPFFLIGIALAAVTVWIERLHVGAQGAGWDLSMAGRCVLAGRALWFYVATLLWPAHLSFVYPRWNVDAPGQYIPALAAVTAIAFLVFMRRRVGKGTVVAALAFVGCTLPALGFFNIYLTRYTFVADHFVYHASLPFIAGVVALVSAASGRAGTARRPLAVLLSAAALIALGTLTWRRAHVFTDAKTLWTDTLDENPDAYLAHNNLSTLLLHTGHEGEAALHASEAIRLRPDDAEPRNNLGNALMAQGRIGEAAAAYAAALQLQPRFAEAHTNLGNALAAEGHLDEAIDHLRTAAQLNPQSATAARSLGNALATAGRADDAIAAYRQALRLDPAQADVHNNLSVLQLRGGRTDQAIAHGEAAVRLAPSSAEAHTNLANALAEARRLDDAISHYKAAAAINPERAELRYNFASALADAGRYAEAETEFRAAVRLQPTFAPARDGLARAVAAQGRTQP